MKCLLEIPVYYISRDDHHVKWEKKRNEYEQRQLKIGTSIDEIKDSFLKCYKIESLWDFNKIVGYIRIVYNSRNGDFEFLIFKSTNKRFFYNKKFKISLEQLYGPNLHVYVLNKKNNEIIQLLSKKIEYIRNNFFKNNYLDLNVFDNMCDYYNFEAFIKNQGSD